MLYLRVSPYISPDVIITTQLWYATTKQPPLYVMTDGPYGHFQIPIKDYSVLVLVAGGIGITPMMSILKYAFVSVVYLA